MTIEASGRALDAIELTGQHKRIFQPQLRLSSGLAILRSKRSPLNCLCGRLYECGRVPAHDSNLPGEVAALVIGL